MKNYFTLTLMLVVVSMSCYGADNVKNRGFHSGHEYVDLGLSSGTLWATCNVGATKPEDAGDYFAWGETRPKEEYNWETYKWCKGSYDTQTKYCTDSDHCTVDNKSILELSDDAANVNWGGDWRMPTKEELDELHTECTWTWTTQNGVKGCKITSKKNSNSIFLPVIKYFNDPEHDLFGHGVAGYWSSSLDGCNFAHILNGIEDINVIVGGSTRCAGFGVRPVLRIGFTYDVYFNSNGGEGNMQSIMSKLRFSVPENQFTRYGYKFVGWNEKSDGTGISYNIGERIQLTKNLTLYAQWEKQINLSVNGHEYVDLGLPSGTLWATCNVGATKPEDDGDYFAWGETTSKTTYDWSTYKWCKGSYDTQTKYCTKSSYGIVDNKVTLELSDDAANVNWGGHWRMPTNEEQRELWTECTWKWITLNGVEGYQVISNINGNSIFLPSTGYYIGSEFYEDLYSFYWTSSLNTSYLSGAIYLNFGFNAIGCDYGDRGIGLNVRPVITANNGIHFDSNGGKGQMPFVPINDTEVIAIPENKFTRIGYKFIGWNTKTDGTGILYANKQKISSSGNLTLYAQWEKSKDIGFSNGHEYIDLGLPSGTLWATMNVGATCPEDFGGYFAWGEISTKSTYSWDNYKFGRMFKLAKYCRNPEYGIKDYKTILELSDDAANVNWGGNWRIPTASEQKELIQYCTWTWDEENCIKGYTVVGPNGNSVFFPATCVTSNTDEEPKGKYWASQRFTNQSSSSLYFNQNGPLSSTSQRCSGLSVRPVLDKGFPFEVTFDSNGGDGAMQHVTVDYAKEFTLPENKFTRYGYKFVGWNEKSDGTGISYNIGQRIFQLTENITFYAEWKKELNLSVNGHEYVDLGLPSGTLWATCNVGATSPEDYGNYYAWGETFAKKYFYHTYTLEDKNIGKDIAGTIYDVATITWGDKWCMPNISQWEELKTMCIWEWTKLNGLYGYIIRSKNNDKSIFLPAAGAYFGEHNMTQTDRNHCIYWSSTLDYDYGFNAYAFSSIGGIHRIDGYLRGYGMSVRPVVKELY